MKKEKGEMMQELSVVGSRAGGGGERCSICLEPISGEGFLDQCFHKFCYHCILQWSEMVISRPSNTSNPLQYLECPLCKTQYTSIIHDLSEAKFQRHYILTSRVPGLFKSETHIRRQAVYSAHSGHATPQPSSLTHVVPKPNRWISCWVQRELQALMQEEDVDTVMHHVIGIVESFNKRSKGKVGVSGKQGTRAGDFDWHATISAAVRPFIFECAERFAVELESFLLSGLDIAAYDQKCKLAACAPEPVTHSDEEITLPPNTYDLFDEDVDEEFGHVMVRRATSEAERYSSEESLETMKQNTREEHPGIQDLESSQREGAVSRKTEKDCFRDSVKDGGSNADRGRSKHRSGLHKKRKRKSSSRRNSSPTGHKHRKGEKGVKSRKKRKQGKKKERKALQDQRRKSHNSRSRKRNHTSSDSSSDSESPTSSRSVSPVERSARLKARKKDAKFVSEKSDSRKVQVRDVDQGTRDQRKRRHHRSSSLEPGESLETDQCYEPSPDNFGRHRQPRLGDRGDQKFEVKDKYTIDADERSPSRSPEARHRRRRLSTPTSPKASAERRPWDAHESSHTPPKTRNDEQTVRPVPLSEVSAQRSDVVEVSAQSSDVVKESARALELNLRGRALANLMRHLSQKEKIIESDPVGNIGESSAVAAELSP